MADGGGMYMGLDEEGGGHCRSMWIGGVNTISSHLSSASHPLAVGDCTSFYFFYFFHWIFMYHRIC